MSVEGVIFPGQGSQRRGMAQDFRDKFLTSRRIFEEASTALGLDIAAICRDETDPRLDLTEFTQPCILTAEIAIFEAVRAEYGYSPVYFGGHSLGEYTALVAAGALPFASAVRLVRRRGKLMQDCVAPGVGAMAAVIMENLPLAELSTRAESFGVDLANDNSAHQVVASGERSALDSFSASFLTFFVSRMAFLSPPSTDVSRS